MAVLSRSAWTTAKNQAPAIKRDQTEIYLHYPGQPGAIGRASQAATARRLRNYRVMHTRGQYSEIAYNWAVDQDGRIWELRGKRQCGGNGGQTTNRRGQAILVLTGNTEQPTEDCIRGINECIAMIRDWQPTARTIRGHRESFEASTVCPGEPIMRLIKAGAFTGNVAQSVPEAVKDAARPWRDSPRAKSMEAAQVERIQKLLGVKADGVYGDKTGTAVSAVQAALELTPDGVWGPATEDAVTTLNELKKDTERLIAFGEQIHWRTDVTKKAVEELPAAIFAHKVPLEGDFKGQSGDAAGIRKWYAHDVKRIVDAVREQGQQNAVVREDVAALGAGLIALDKKVDALVEALTESKPA